MGVISSRVEDQDPSGRHHCCGSVALDAGKGKTLEFNAAGLARQIAPADQRDRAVAPVQEVTPWTADPSPVGLLPWLPVFVAAVASAAVSIAAIIFRLTRHYPLNPYESEYFVDGYRALHGLAVYEPLGVGHATMAYGPLEPYLLGLLFRLGGPSFLAARAVSTAAGLLICGLFIRCIAELRTLAYGFIVAAMVLALQLRCRAFLTEARPDLASMALAVLAILVAFEAHRRGRSLLYALVVPLIVTAFLFKQTYAVAALIPPLAILLTRPKPLARHLALTATPILGLLLCVIALKIFFPLVWFYSFTSQSQFQVSLPRLLEALYDLLLYSPLYLALAFAVALHPKLGKIHEDKILWIHAATLAGGAASMLAFAKHGGSFNSLLLGFVPMIAFSVIMLPRVLRLVSEQQLPLFGRVGVPITLGLCFLATTFGVPRSEDFAFHDTWGSDSYGEMIRFARTLHGRVISPDDPTITLFAFGKLDRSIDAEAGAYGLPSVAPLPVVRYLQSADIIIRMTSNAGPKPDEWMKGIGYRQTLRSTTPPGYSIWRRNRAPRHTAPTTETP
jgi:hypothetical protein